MIQIDEPPQVLACASCASPLVWLYSLRRQGWVAFVPVDDSTLRLHGCRPLQEPATWRDLRRGDPPNEDYLAAKRELQERSDESAAAVLSVPPTRSEEQT